ncbi:hypothetical protein V6N12_069680 [Hibiscus sabdariffa]|uniref:Uncharacterized protein n=1 Tax=Hibiscus sabdariffa TaxID=183260 RepID=A0ABR2FF03_9ROSI
MSGSISLIHQRVNIRTSANEWAGKDEELSEPNKRDQLGGQGNQGFKEVGDDPSNLVEDIQKKISRYASGTTVLWM